MAWQPKERVEEVVSPFLRDSPGLELAPELAPRDSQAIFDKLSMSASEDTPLGFALRDAQVSAFAIVGVEAGRHRADGSPRRGSRPHPGGRRRRLRRRNQAAAKRSLDALATAGDAILTDVSTITGRLAHSRQTPEPVVKA
jgi:biuret amidohydrolase